MLLLHSQSFPHYGLERFFQFAKEAGFDGVEINIDENFDTQDPEYLKKLEKRFNMPIKAFSLAYKKEEALFEVFQETVKEFSGVSLNLSSPQSFAFRYKKWMTQVVPKLCKKYDLHLNYRNVPFKLIFGVIPERTENSLYSLREKGRVCLDLSALWASKEEAMRTIGFMGDKLKHVYLSNVHRNLPYSPLPTGVLPLESFLAKLGQGKFEGDFSVKLSPQQIHEGDEKKMIATLIESREFFEKYFVAK